MDEMGQSDPLDRTATDRARRLRRDATDAEVVMWRLFRASQLAGAKFRRQSPLIPNPSPARGEGLYWAKGVIAARDGTGTEVPRKLA
jgi:hypothetical protein